MRHNLRTIFLLLTLVISLPIWPSEVPKKNFVVVIDPGHGGHDPGAIGKNKIKEKNINLKTALVLGELIEKNCADVKVVYTRKTDVFVELHKRADIANKAKADLFISIHTNALPKGKIARGAETYTLGMARANENLEVAKRENSVILQESDYQTVYKGFNPNSSESYIIFEIMQDANMSQSVDFAKKVQSQFRNTAKRIDKGVKQAGFLVLRETTMPSVLVELGYISTPDEEQFLGSDAGAKTMGRSLYQAFLSYKNGKKGVTADNEPAWAPVEEAAEEPVEVKPVQTSTQEVKNEVKAQTQTTTASKDNAPVFKIQILTSDKPLSSSDRRLQGLKNVEYYKEGGIYKYTYGASTNYNQVVKTRKEILSKFKDCFIIAFRGEEKMDVNEAIRIYKANK